MSKNKISIIIPAYNEGMRIQKTLTEYLSYFSQQKKFHYEIIVVLNGCKDNTAEIANLFTSSFKELKVLEYKDPIGKGGAVAKGFKKASGSYIAYVDADCSTKPEELYRLFNIALRQKAFDSVIASRSSKFSKVSKKKISRKMMSKGFNIVVNGLFNFKIMDTQCGAKIFTKKAIKSIVNNLKISNLAFDIDLLYELKQHNFKVLEAPTTWEDSAGSTISSPIRTSMIMFFTVIKLKLIKSKLKLLYKTLQPLGTKIEKKFILKTHEYNFRYI